jgi:nucleotide-binding universal stress UspA family protein
MNTTPDIKHIVVAHDFSDTAVYAFGYALGIAAKFGARVTVVHVYDVATFGYPDAFVASFDWASEVERIALESLGQIVESARPSGVDVRTELRRGPAWSEIAAFATESGADLVVMGTHGRRGVARTLLGSVAEKVVRVAPCPVLTVHLPPRKGGAAPPPHDR